MNAERCRSEMQCQLRVFSPDVENGKGAEDFGSGFSVKVYHFNTASAIQGDGLTNQVDGESDYIRAESVCQAKGIRAELLGKTSDLKGLVMRTADDVIEKCATESPP